MREVCFDARFFYLSWQVARIKSERGVTGLNGFLVVAKTMQDNGFTMIRKMLSRISKVFVLD